MTNQLSSLDVAAWFIAVAEQEGCPISRLALQKLVSLSQSLYGYDNHEKLYDEDVMAYPYGPVTEAVRNTYGDSKDSDIREPRTELKPLTAEQLDTLSRIWGEFAPLTPGNLVDATHDMGPWSKYYREKGPFRPIPWNELVDAWPDYELDAETRTHTASDHTPGNYCKPQENENTYDEMFSRARRNARVLTLS